MYLAIFGGTGPLLPHAGFLWLQRVGGWAQGAVCGLLISAASLVSALRASSRGTEAWLLCSMRDLPDQGSNLCPLHCKADS